MDLAVGAILGACRTEGHNGQKRSGRMPRLCEPKVVALAFDIGYSRFGMFGNKQHNYTKLTIHTIYTRPWAAKICTKHRLPETPLAPDPIADLHLKRISTLTVIYVILVIL
jgi:hypothetical protein